MYTELTIPVPGKFDRGIAFLDIETQKVPCEYRMANGEMLRRRWQCYLVGVGRDGVIRLVESVGRDEVGLLAGVRKAIGPASKVVYEATREFDEMILRGRFTNARRAHAATAFYPAVPDAETLPWAGIRYNRKNGHVLASIRAVEPAFRGRGMRLIHNLRDVAELIWAYGNPDAECADWCKKVMRDTSFALRLVRVR
jgi:hypothetical protein